MAFDASTATLEADTGFDAATAQPEVEFDASTATEEVDGSSPTSEADTESGPSPTVGDYASLLPAGIARSTGAALAGAARVAKAIPGSSPVIDVADKASRILGGPDVYEAVTNFGRDIADRAMSDYNINPAARQTFGGKVIEGAGSIVPVLASGPLAIATGGALAGESAREEAELSGASDDDKAKTFILNAVTGAVTERFLGVPALLRSARAAASPVLQSVAKQIAAQAAKSFGREGAQETLQQFAQDAFAKWVTAYDPDRNAFDLKKLAETFLIGGVIGGPFGAVTQLAATTDARLRARQATLPDASTLPTSTEPVEQTPQTTMARLATEAPPLVAPLAPESEATPLSAPSPAPTEVSAPEVAPVPGVPPDSNTTDVSDKEARIQAILQRHKLSNDNDEKRQLWEEAKRLDMEMLAEEQAAAKAPEEQMEEVAASEPPPVTPLNPEPAISEPAVEPGPIGQQPPPIAVEEGQPAEAVAAAPVTTSEGPGAMGPAEATEMQAGQKKIGGYNADVEASQKARGQSPTMSEARKEDPVTWESAMAEIEKNPTAPEALVERIHNDPKKPITDEEQQMLTWRRGDLENKMAQESERAIDPSLSPEEQATHQANAELIESQLLRTEEANRMAGTSAGRSLRSRQLEMRDDYTFAGLMMRRRKLTGEVVPTEEAAIIKEQAEKIVEQQKEVERLSVVEEEAAINVEVARTQAATIRDLQEDIAGRPKFGKEVFEIAHQIVNRWKAEADVSRLALRKSLGQTNVGVDPTIVLHVAKIIRAKIGELGLNFAETKTALLEEFGRDIEPLLSKAWAKAQQLIGKENAPPRVKEAVKAGVKKKGEKTPVNIKARAKAEATAGEELSHKTVYDLARAFINEGVHGENAVMKAVHEAVVEAYPAATERDVRRAYSEYGKIKFPSREADKVELAELRQLVKMQEDMDRMVKDNADALRQGFQRPKATQAIRDKIKQRNELLKKRKGPPSAETLASRDEAKKTALRNSIEDLDRQLQTGQKPPQRTPAQDSPEVERLKAERDAMRAKLAEIEGEENPPTSAEQKALNDALVARERLDRILTGEEITIAKAAKEPLTEMEADIRSEISAMREQVAQMRRDTLPEKDPNAAREAAQIKALETSIENYSRKVRDGDFTTRGPKQGPDTQRIAALKAIRDSRKSMYEAAKKLTKPTLTPEERYNRNRANQIQRQIEAAEKRIATSDYAPGVKKVQPALTRANLDAKAKLEQLKRDVKQGEEQYRLAHRTALEKAKERASFLLQSARGIVLGSDIGVLTRQGLFAWSRPRVAIPATVEALKSAVSPASMARWEIEVRDREINGESAAPIRKAAGLQLTDTLSNPEELVVTRLLSRIPDFNVGGKTIKLSAIGRTLERFQTTFINAVRADTLDAGIRSGMTPEELKQRANFINSATGRSNLKRVPQAMSLVFTSPRYETSRWEMLAQPIRNLGALAQSGVKGELNKASLANLQDVAVTMALIYGLFKWAELDEYEVEWDPMSSDFLKMRKGDEVWDPTAGIAPRLRDLMRIYVAISHPSYNDNIGKTLLSATLRAINPAIKIPIDQLSVANQRRRGDKDPKLPFSGFRSEEEREGWIAMAPLIVQSVNKSLDDPNASPVFTAGREFIGQSVQSYPKKKEKKTKPISAGTRP